MDQNSTTILRAAQRAVFAAWLLTASQATAAELFTGNYSQNFDTLAATGTTGSIMPTGWTFLETGTGANATYGVGNGSSATGNSYSFGATGSTDRALGTLASASITPAQFGVFFTNNTGLTITSLNLSYVGEQWRAGTSTDDQLAFSYSLDATALNNGTWVTVSALDFHPLVTSGQMALDGNSNSTTISGTLNGLIITSGQSFAFRWTDVDSTAFDHGMGIDNMALNIPAVPEPSGWAMMMAGFGIMGAVYRRQRPIALVT